MRRSRFLLAAAVACATLDATGAPRRTIALTPVTLDLPGPPATIVSADLDGDSRKDLLVVSVFTSWGQVSQDRVEDAVQITEVVPALFDRREARAWLASSRGGYTPLAPMSLPPSVHHVEAGPPGIPAVALVDGGLAALRVREVDGAPRLLLERIIESRTVLDGSDAYLPALRITADVDADAAPDLMLPTPEGIAIHLARDGVLLVEPSARVRFPAQVEHSWLGAVGIVDVPRLEDVDGDGLGDLVVIEPGREPRIHVARGLGEGRFAPSVGLGLACTGIGATPLGTSRSRGDSKKKKEPEAPPPPVLSYFGDLDGDGRAEVVTRQETDGDRGELDQAREPRSRYRFHRVGGGLAVEPKPYLDLTIPGYATSGDFLSEDPDFKDLDGDRRKDLVAVTLDFSVLQAVRVLMTKRISVGLDFTVWAQQPDGTFRAAPNRGLDEKLKFDLDDLRVGRMAQFAGDFDGDGRIDFVHLGRGRTVTIHQGQPGGLYSAKPDLAVELREEPQDLALVRVADYDGDGRADLAITRVGTATDEDASRPASLDLLLSAGAP